MKKLNYLFLIALMMTACGEKKATNPLIDQPETPYRVPAFDQIKLEHYEPAFDQAIKEDSLEVEQIANNADAPTFENTIAALDRAGKLLDRVEGVFFNIVEADGNDAMETINERVTARITALSDNILLNEKLFARVKAVYEQRDSLGLNAEERRLTEETYRTFAVSGADLPADKKERLKEINQELSQLSIKFSSNVVAETNACQIFIQNEADLKGLPEVAKQAAAEEAAAAGHAGEWLFTPKRTSFTPVLQYCENRELRKQLLLAYTTRGNHNNENDNKEVIRRTMQLRIEKAKLFGFDNPAQYILQEQMAKTPEAAMAQLMYVWYPALEQAKKEAAKLQQLMDAEGKGEKLEPWDWWYYTEKLRAAEYDLNEEQLKPYFQLENVRNGAFQVANKLYGLTFEPLKDMPVYNPEVEVFKVTDADGSFIGIYYTDYFPRAGKRPGAWMNDIAHQYVENGENHRPVIINVGNFNRPTSDKPALLSMDDVETLFHEFGHALHGFLSQCTYKTLAGTNTPRDFVEFPSQLMENWCYEPEVMRTYAFHYQTGEVIPDSLIEKIQQSRTFNKGFVEVELLSASILDMDYHMLNNADSLDVEKFEAESLAKMGMIDEIIVRYRSTFFNHIFTTGYEAGYYSYTGSAVLDADCFHAFKETGNLFDQTVATALRRNVLERGNTDDCGVLYRNFRGKDANPQYLLDRLFGEKK